MACLLPQKKGRRQGWRMCLMSCFGFEGLAPRFSPGLSSGFFSTREAWTTLTHLWPPRSVAFLRFRTCRGKTHVSYPPFTCFEKSLHCSWARKKEGLEIRTKVSRHTNALPVCRTNQAFCGESTLAGDDGPSRALDGMAEGNPSLGSQSLSRVADACLQSAHAHCTRCLPSASRPRSGSEKLSAYLSS
jgi:hypothetical protein